MHNCISAHFAYNIQFGKQSQVATEPKVNELIKKHLHCDTLSLWISKEASHAIETIVRSWWTNRYSYFLFDWLIEQKREWLNGRPADWRMCECKFKGITSNFWQKRKTHSKNADRDLSANIAFILYAWRLPWIKQHVTCSENNPLSNIIRRKGQTCEWPCECMKIRTTRNVDETISKMASVQEVHMAMLEMDLRRKYAWWVWFAAHDAIIFDVARKRPSTVAIECSEFISAQILFKWFMQKMPENHCDFRQISIFVLHIAHCPFKMRALGVQLVSVVRDSD